MFRKQNWRIFRKTDEMEHQIQTQAIRYAYFFLVVALLIWTISGNIIALQSHTRTTTLIPCFLLVAASIIQNIAVLLLRRHKTSGDEEYKSAAPFGRALLAGLSIAVVSTMVLSAFTFWLISMW